MSTEYKFGHATVIMHDPVLTEEERKIALDRVAIATGNLIRAAEKLKEEETA